jgi:broad specificity phosphatase PhoE
MGVFKQMMIDKMDEMHGGDIEGLTEQDIIDAMVEEYMRSDAYHKEHMDQEKKIANSLTSSDSSAKI